jgi:hypothetical protein
MKTRSLIIIFAVFFLAFLDGCEFSWTKLQREWDAWTRSFQQMRKSEVNGSLEKPEPERQGIIYDQTRANAELLHEIYTVVLQNEPTDLVEFRSLVDSMNQGASLEGIYNGFVHSRAYEELEMGHAGAPPEVLQIFSEELAYLEAELPVQGALEDSQDTLATAKRLGVKPAVISDKVVDLNVLTERFSRLYLGAPMFALKRMLGDKALLVIHERRQSSHDLAMWYAKWAVRTNMRGVYFGLASRNKPDERFHYQWAASAGSDRIRWEVLNRLHRLLNEANRQKQ